uniref:Uncharacterized protein n=1 Tax=Rhizophora mucronata TaxID=61149 RepID=A0A2P2IQV0_RHIMU
MLSSFSSCAGPTSRSRGTQRSASRPPDF